MFMYSIRLKGEVIGKKNNYRVTKTGGFYRDPKFASWEEDVLWQIKSQRIPKLAGKFHLKVILNCKKDRDLDNSITSICDILQKSGTIDNDKNIIQISAVKNSSKMVKQPGALIELELL